MYWKKLLLDSFVRGLGKTSAALIVCGVVGGAWTLYNMYSFEFTKKTINNDKKNVEVDMDMNMDIDTDSIVDSDTDTESDANLAIEEFKFKKIFDKL